MPEPEAYEIVSIDPLSRIEKRNENLEKDIREIRAALRGTVGLSQLEAGADEFISQMLGLMETSQKMVQEVAVSNQQVAKKIQEAIDNMNESNKALSDKMTRVLDFFSRAAESMGGEEEGGVSDVLSSSLDALHESLDSLVDQNKATHETLMSIEKHLKKQNVATSAPVRAPRPPVPQRRTPYAVPGTPQGFPPPPAGAPSGLPPPPPPPR